MHGYACISQKQTSFYVTQSIIVHFFKHLRQFIRLALISLSHLYSIDLWISKHKYTKLYDLHLYIYFCLYGFTNTYLLTIHVCKYAILYVKVYETWILKRRK